MTTHYLTALLEAQRYAKSTLDEQAQMDAAVSLAEWGLFSRRAIAHIVGLSVSRVLQLAPKSDRSGGRFHVDSLPHLIELIHLRERGEVNVFEAQAALEKTSVYFAAKATGIPKSSLARWADRAREMVAA